MIDSGLNHIGFLTSEGTLTDLGYKYVAACERINNAQTGIPLEILRASLLKNGQYAALLHYIHKLSEEIFQDDIFRFSEKNKTKENKYLFKSGEYLNFIDDIFANHLNISRKSTTRANKTRKSFQAEMSIMKKLGFVRNVKSPFRVGLGLEIDWPQVHSSLLYFEKNLN